MGKREETTIAEGVREAELSRRLRRKARVQKSSRTSARLRGELSTVYGPVPSWRLGRSLGVDVVLPPKACTFDCIYCQLGKTGIQVSRPEALPTKLVDAKRVGQDLDRVLKRLDIGTVDAVTFSGTGEPTLNPELGEIAKAVRKRIDDAPMVILTNSSLLYKRRVRDNLATFDLIVAKLDAGDDTTFRAINRPAADTRLTIAKVVDSIKKLKHTVHGAVALEVMLLCSADNRVTNVRGKPMGNLVDTIADVDPVQVQMEVPYRPPSESYVRVPSGREIAQIAARLAQHFKKDRLQVYGFHDKHIKNVRWLVHDSFEKEAIELLERRPCDVNDVSRSLGITSSAANALLDGLVRKDLVTVETWGRARYHCIRTRSLR
jgi:wyosine [tRNA(Phe)-imidazoG37] synthetase (radical SAM superfamily)